MARRSRTFRYHPGPLQDGECVNDPGHDWITMHGAWNNGNNDNWLPAQANESPLVGNVPVTMGYYTRHDIPIHYLLADAFMICDQYHCSLLGGTTPNRLYWMSATIDPSGQNGGPQLVEPNVQPVQHFSWTIMPENLSAAGLAGRLNSPMAEFGRDQALTRRWACAAFDNSGFHYRAVDAIAKHDAGGRGLPAQRSGRSARFPRPPLAAERCCIATSSASCARPSGGRDLEAQIKRRVAATARRAARCRFGPKGCASSKHREIGESRILS
jgi:hypothetical protein